VAGVPFQAKGWDVPDVPNAPPPNLNPFGGVPSGGTSYGGGGSGGATVLPGLDQGSFNSWLDFVGGAAPGNQVWNNVNLPEYNAPDFYDWDNTAYNTARTGVGEGIAAGLASGQADFDVARAQLDQYQNPYGNVRTANSGTTDAMTRMLQSQGVGMGAADETMREGQMADAGFGYTQNLLAGAADQRQAGNLRALAGDRRHFSETLAGEERAMNMSIQIAEQKAKAQYDKDLFMYGKEEADKNYEINLQEAIMNAQGQQRIGEANVNATNQFNQGIIDPITQMWLEGRNSEGVQGLSPLDRNVFA